MLSDGEKGQLISIWIIAGDKKGEIPHNAKVLQKVCGLDEVPDINKFIDLGFLEIINLSDDVNMASTCQPDDAPEKRRGEENRKEKHIVVQDKKPARPRPFFPSQEIVGYLNEKAGKSFKPNPKPTIQHITARFKEGFTLEDFKTVIDFKVNEWGTDPKMMEFIRPQTLFGTKFESYLEAAKAAGYGTGGTTSGIVLPEFVPPLNGGAP